MSWSVSRRPLQPQPDAGERSPWCGSTSLLKLSLVGPHERAANSASKRSLTALIQRLLGLAISRGTSPWVLVLR
uniref:Uncharacterized protein n=1 Tax=Arundo donax TaxID=35708 RepID=A0A0A9D2B0_ARUDO